MIFQTGIAISHESDTDIFVAAATWFRDREPNFATRNLTFAYMREHLAAVVVVQNDSVVPAINAACHRTIESLLIRRLLPPGNQPQVTLVLPPSLAKEKYVLPVTKTRNHWLITAADRYLMDWLRGER